MAMRLQTWIHKLEEGTGGRLVRVGLGLMALLAVAVFYNLTQYRNLHTAEGMDQAQVGRSLAEGRGFETRHVRPLSLHLVFRQATNVLLAAQPGGEGNDLDAPPTPEEAYWLGLLQEAHPDLAHPPLYPLLLAGVLKLHPDEGPGSGEAEAFGPDRWIALLNQGLFLLAVWLTFGLARSWFDLPVAMVAAAAMILSEMLWRFTTSGLSVMVQIVLFLLLLQVLGRMERLARVEGVSSGSLVRRALLVGVLLGLLALTRYSLLLLLVPAALLLGSLPHPRRGLLAGLAVAVGLLVVAPWVARNVHLSGTPFGTAGFALFLDTYSFPGDSLERSINPDFREFTTSELRRKLFEHLPRLLQDELPRLGGSWLSGFLLVGLLVPFRSLALARLRRFLLGALLLAVCVAALGAGAVPEEAGVEGWALRDPLLTTFAPAVFVFGASLFMTLVGQLEGRFPGIQLPATGLFCLLLGLPLLFRFFVPVSTPLVFPPYYPPWIREKAAYLDEGDWSMSDIPWAFAWYGNRRAVWWPADYRSRGTGRYRNDFYEIHDNIRSINALYLSSAALEKVETGALMGWISRTEEASWEDQVSAWDAFILVGIYLKNEVPEDFPLKNAPLGIFPELFLVDSEHIESKTIQSP